MVISLIDDDVRYSNQIRSTEENHESSNFYIRCKSANTYVKYFSH